MRLSDLKTLPKCAYPNYPLFVRYDFVQADDTQDGFGIEINWLSVLFIALLTGLMLLGTSESTYVQNASVTIYLCLISFIVFGGASQV